MYCSHLQAKYNHLDKCHLVIHIDSTGIGPSTVVLESFIMNKPVLNIVLKDVIHEFECIKDGALPTVKHDNDFEKILVDLTF